MIKQKTAIIVDDSFLIKKVIRNILEELKYKIVGEASNGIEAIKKIKLNTADLLIIDVMMPKMDGLTALSNIMKIKPTKTLVVSAYDPKQMNMAYKALEYGAVAFIQKNTNLKLFKQELKTQIKLAEQANLPRKGISTFIDSEIKNKGQTWTVIKSQHLLIIGASTGGPGLVHEVIANLKKPFPPVIIIQHLPTGFTESFATRLQTKTDLTVVVAEDGMNISNNTVFIAPGGKHLILKQNKAIYFETYAGDRINGVIPSLDPTILSASHIYKNQLTVAIFTGMGNDGLAGVRSAKQNKAFVFTQNEDTCVIYGMPKAINEENLSDYINTPNNIIMALNRRLSG